MTKNVYDGINWLVEIMDAYDHIVKQLGYNDADVQIASYDALNNKMGFYTIRTFVRQEAKMQTEIRPGWFMICGSNISEKKDTNGKITSYQYDVYENRDWNDYLMPSNFIYLYRNIISFK